MASPGTLMFTFVGGWVIILTIPGIYQHSFQLQLLSCYATNQSVHNWRHLVAVPNVFSLKSV